MSLDGTDPCAGDFTLSAFAGTTNAIAFNATTATIQTRLETYSAAINPGDVLVTGGPMTGAPVSIQCIGRYADQDVDPITRDDTNLINNELQQITFLGAPTGGTFRLDFNGVATGDIVYDGTGAGTAAGIKAELETLTAIDNVTVTPLSNTQWTVEFIGTGSDVNQTQPVEDDDSVTGGAGIIFTPLVDLSIIHI